MFKRSARTVSGAMLAVAKQLEDDRGRIDAVGAELTVNTEGVGWTTSPSCARLVVRHCPEQTRTVQGCPWGAASSTVALSSPPLLPHCRVGF